MEILRQSWSQYPPEAYRHGTAVIGNFDGVHRGHVRLLAIARELADDLQSPLVAMTFDPHPLLLLNPSRWQAPLTAIEQRAELLAARNVDALIVMETSPALLALEPGAFFEDILGRQLAIRGLVEGYNFHFGRSREGTNALLRTMCDEIGAKFHEMPAYTWNDSEVSSTRIRRLLLDGEMPAAADLLDRPYRIEGKVIHGAARGRTIGYPTANLGEVETLIPAEGVYAMRCRVGGRDYIAAANVGPNPTFGEDARKIEIYLLNFSGDLYGQTVRGDFIERLRPTMKFAGVEALKAQMAMDVERVRTMLG